MSCSTAGVGGGAEHGAAEADDDDTSAASAPKVATSTTTGGTVGPPGEHGSDASEDDAGDERRQCRVEEGGDIVTHTSDEDEEDDSALIQRITSALVASNHPICGSDSRGLRTYTSIANLWNDQPDHNNIDHHFDGKENVHQPSPLKTGEWYERALAVYDDPDVIPATVDGMLGGQAHVSIVDVEASRAFLIQVLGEMQSETQPGSESESQSQSQSERPLPGPGSRAAEMGAGIGRVTKHLLSPIGYDNCDLIESSSRLLEAAPEYLGDEIASKCRFFCTGLQDWTPTEGCYDLIWIQWVMCYLTDVDLVKFLRSCRVALGDGGLVVLKENVLSRDADGEEGFVVDEDDASLTRSLPYLMTLCDVAGFDVVTSCWQEDFPAELFPVRMIALVPRKGRGRR